MTLMDEITNYKNILTKAEDFVRKNNLKLFIGEGVPFDAFFGSCWLIRGNSIIEVNTVFFIDDPKNAPNLWPHEKKEIKKKYVITLHNMIRRDISFLSRPEQFTTGREITCDVMTEVIKFLEVFAKNGFVWYVR